MSIAIGRARQAVFAVALAVVLSVALIGASFAGANPPPNGNGNGNNVNLTIRGGDAVALAACVNVASKAAKYNKKLQVNACKNFASATGGDVKLTDVEIIVTQTAGGGTTAGNNVDLTIRGGDATAIAACVNYLEGDATSAQVNICKNTAVAKGGDVKLKNVSIVIFQE